MRVEFVKRMLGLFAISVASVVLLTSCATVVKGTYNLTKQRPKDQRLFSGRSFRQVEHCPHALLLQSSPSSATVKVLTPKGRELLRGETPMVAMLTKDAGFLRRPLYKVFFEKEGYRPKMYLVSGRIDWRWYVFGNIIVGGIPGWLLIDPMTGAMWDLKPPAIKADLEIAQEEMVLEEPASKRKPAKHQREWPPESVDTNSWNHIVPR